MTTMKLIATALLIVSFLLQRVECLSLCSTPTRRKRSASQLNEFVNSVTRPKKSIVQPGCFSATRGNEPMSRLFSVAPAALLDDGPYDEDESNISRYGPAIKVGSLKINIFGMLFGVWEIFWGVFFWYPAMTLYSLLRKVLGNFMEKIDPYRRIPICFGYFWGLLSLSLFRLWPKVEGWENLEVLRDVDNSGKKGKLKPALYVANHCSWMDIPFVGKIFGFNNYKIIAKSELLKVPILGKAIKTGGHVVLDRTNRRSQMQAYKAGIQWLKDGVNLVTFPEGTRSKNSRMGSFKMGAFKMAQAVGASVVPLSISYADSVQPLDYAFPVKSSRARPGATITIGEPISTVGKNDEELLNEVWSAIADKLPDSQKPDKDTPVGTK